jgi:hypothetical protein
MQDVLVKLNTELPLQKQYLTRRKLLISKLDLNLSKKLVKCYIWSTDLRGTEIWTFWKEDQKYLESFEMCIRRRVGQVA